MVAWFFVFVFLYLPAVYVVFRPSRKRKAVPTFVADDSFEFVGGECKVAKRCRLSDPSSCFSCDRERYSCARLEDDLGVVDPSTGNVLSVLPKNESEDDGYCLPSRDAKCNPRTASYLLARLPGTDRMGYLCKCKYPSLVDQNSPFEDCNVIRACQPGGTFVGSLDVDPLKHGRCECHDEDYAATRDDESGPRCEPRRRDALVACHPGAPIERIAAVDDAFAFFLGGAGATCDCPRGYVSSDSPAAVRAGYLPAVGSMFDPPQCVKKPCLWDAIEGAHYNGDTNRHDPKYGCVCDYDLGWVGIDASGDEDAAGRRLVVGQRYSACARVAVPRPPVRHESVTTFYSGSGTVTTHVYPRDSVVPWLVRLVGEGRKLYVDEAWTHSHIDYFQRVLKSSGEVVRLSIQCKEEAWGRQVVMYNYSGRGVPREHRVPLRFGSDCDRTPAYEAHAFRPCSEVATKTVPLYENLLGHWDVHRFHLYYVDYFCLSDTTEEEWRASVEKEDEKNPYAGLAISNVLAAADGSYAALKLISERSSSRVEVDNVRGGDWRRSKIPL